MIECVKCGEPTRTVDTRFIYQLNQCWRRHECVECGHRFNTMERIIKGLTAIERSKLSEAKAIPRGRRKEITDTTSDGIV